MYRILRLCSEEGSLEGQLERTIEQLGVSGHVWQAQKLLAAALKTSSLFLEGWPTWDTVRSLISSFHTSDHAPSVLAKLAMIGDFSQSTLTLTSKKRSIVLDTVKQQVKIFMESLLPPHSTSTSTKFLNNIDTDISETRQLKYALYSRRCLEEYPAHTHDFAVVESDRQDHAMTLLAQINAARCEQFRNLDLRLTYQLFTETHDKLGLLRLLAVLDHHSSIAKDVLVAGYLLDWTDDTLMVQIEKELRSPSGSHEFDLESLKQRARSRSASTTPMTKVKPANRVDPKRSETKVSHEERGEDCGD